MTFASWLDSLQHRSVAIVGIGVSNTPLIRLLARHGVQVTACDKATREQVSWLLKEFALDRANRGLNMFVDCNTME